MADASPELKSPELTDLLAGRRVRLVTFGCKVNQVESAFLAEVLTTGGAVLTSGEEAELVVINTCAVTGRSEQQARQAIRHWARRRPQLGLVVTGCYAQRAPQELAGFSEVRAVLGNAAKGAWPQLLPRLLAETTPQIVVPDWPPGRELAPLPLTSFPGHSRAFLKIQDGCEHYCHYCIVPQVRGPERSLPAEAVLEQARGFMAAGHRELVLTGINLGRYGRARQNGPELPALVRRLRQAGLPGRWRLSSLEPQELSEALLRELAAWPSFCPHFHLPLQSGSPAVLAAMGRDYQPSWFADLILDLSRRFPEAALGLDILVGFPTETEADFLQTLNLVARLPVAYLHVFPYSPRPGTPAAALPRRPSPAAVKARSRQLLELSRRKRQAFAVSNLQRELTVLVEGPVSRRPGWLQGLSANYLRIFFPGPREWRHLLVRVIPRELAGLEVRGEALAVVA